MTTSHKHKPYFLGPDLPSACIFLPLNEVRTVSSLSLIYTHMHTLRRAHTHTHTHIHTHTCIHTIYICSVH